MPESDDYATIRTDVNARDQARVTKAKLGLTWSEFHARAADLLDPESNS